MTFTEAVEKIKNEQATCMRRNWTDPFGYSIKYDKLIRVYDYDGWEQEANLMIDDYLAEDWEVF